MPRYPPIVFLVKGADGDGSCAAGDSELVLEGTPANVGGCAVDTEENQSRLPYGSTCSRVRSLSPDIGVPVLGCSDDSVRVGCPVDGRDEFVVLR